MKKMSDREILGNWNLYTIKSCLGVIGLQLYFHANRIDRTEFSNMN